MRLQPARSDDLWPRLRRHLERAEGFSINFIFSPSRRRSAELQAQLEGALRWRTSLLDVFDPFEHPRWREGFLDAATGSQAERIRMRAPLWVVLDRHAGRPEADAVRREALAALNERRGALERHFARPLILALPQGFNAEVWAYAPDLWTIRGFAGELPAEPGETQQAARASAVEAAASAPVPDAEVASLPAIREWRRLAKIAAAEPERVVPASGWAATEAALHAGALAMAAAIAQDVSTLARARAERSPGDPEAQRDLSVALDNVGRVAQAQGEWAEAEAVYRESLAIRRTLAERLATPEAQRDLSVSLDNVGRVARVQGEWAEAEAVYRESLAIRRTLAERLATPEAQRDLSISLDNVGRVAEAQGEWAEAEAVYRESLTIARTLAERLATPEAQRDLSVLLNNLGRVARAQGEWAEAEAVYRESLAIARTLAERLATPEAQRDLSVALDNVGRVAQAQGEWAEAEAIYRESLAIARRVADAVGQTPQSLQDLDRALVSYAGIVTGPEKISLLREAETTYRRLATRQPNNTELKDKLASVERMLKEAADDRPLQGS